MDDRDIEFLMDAREDEPEQEITMDFTENELLELLTAVADQKTYYRQAAAQCRADTGHGHTYYEGKLQANTDLYHKLHAMLAAIELAEKL
jgi:DNA-binding MltR family transcriptional regulator